jgi:hypothetical protein
MDKVLISDGILSANRNVREVAKICESEFLIIGRQRVDAASTGLYHRQIDL